MKWHCKEKWYLSDIYEWNCLKVQNHSSPLIPTTFLLPFVIELQTKLVEFTEMPNSNTYSGTDFSLCLIRLFSSLIAPVCSPVQLACTLNVRRFHSMHQWSKLLYLVIFFPVALQIFHRNVVLHRNQQSKSSRYAKRQIERHLFQRNPTLPSKQ